ncbi:MAG: hypothetical protein JSR27_11565 [Proteobacteria bacterium]|nr:hypothetical protein [Pseudomonadota bacterium]
MLIRVSNTINAADLFNEASSVDVVQSADRLATRTSSAWSAYLQKRFPNALVDIRMSVNFGVPVSNNIVFVEFGEPTSYAVRNEINAKLGELALGEFFRSGWMAYHSV